MKDRSKFILLFTFLTVMFAWLHILFLIEIPEKLAFLILPDMFLFLLWGWLFAFKDIFADNYLEKEKR